MLGQQWRKKLGKVFVDEFCHFKHVHCFFCAENFLKLLIWIDIALVLRILQVVFLDVRPELFSHFCTWDWCRADYSSEVCARFHRLHKL